ncbi:unnamed protein product [Moneuplotes crassus]|uniref:Uncharacterized protein n=1 Tax=Euplotes crassus TaxID=5936 RepID=A0AAD1Y3F0_EUPCR|nr:unnamed protein product [Moneuplotes crassus]
MLCVLERRYWHFKGSCECRTCIRITCFFGTVIFEKNESWIVGFHGGFQDVCR